MARLTHHRLMTTAADVKARCTVDPLTHCWLWQGARNTRSQLPMVYAFDYTLGDKKSMSGPRAVWQIAHGEAPRPGHLIYRCCNQVLCLNPAHLRQAATKAEIGVHVRRSGRLKGRELSPAQRAVLPRSWAAQGIVPTGPDAVRAIRAAGPEVTGVQLALEHGISPQTVSRIRRGESHRGVS